MYVFVSSRINTALSEQRNGEKCNMLSPKTYLKDLTEGDAVTGFVYEVNFVCWISIVS